MTTRGTWKKRERQVMKFFGSTRKPVSGRQRDKDGDDGEHFALHVQQKHRQTHAVLNTWRAAKSVCDKSGKIPVVTLSEHNREGFWILCHSSDLKQIANFAESPYELEEV
jgi:hypothetical protein